MSVILSKMVRSRSSRSSIVFRQTTFIAARYNCRNRPCQQGAADKNLMTLGAHFMQDNFIECPELAGKTIQEFRIHRDTGDGTSVEIRLTDGTTFSCSLSVRPGVKASLYRGGAGIPEVLQNYEV